MPTDPKKTWHAQITISPEGFIADRDTFIQNLQDALTPVVTAAVTEWADRQNERRRHARPAPPAPEA